MTRTGVSVVIAISMMFSANLHSTAAETPRYSTPTERFVSSAISSSPDDYLAAVVSVQSMC